MNCPKCGGPMRSLFLANSLFCPNGCDRRAAGVTEATASDDPWGRWNRAESGWEWMALRHGTPIPDDAVGYDRWGATGVSLDEIERSVGKLFGELFGRWFDGPGLRMSGSVKRDWATADSVQTMVVFRRAPGAA